MSNESQLTLASVQPSVSGKYSCEVSADAPSFHTLIETGDLEVVGKCRCLFIFILFIYRLALYNFSNCISQLHTIMCFLKQKLVCCVHLTIYLYIY